MPALKLYPQSGYLVAVREPRRTRAAANDLEFADTVSDDSALHDEECRSDVRTSQLAVTRSAESPRTKRAHSSTVAEKRALNAMVLNGAIEELRGDPAYTIRACAARAGISEKLLRLVLLGERPCPVDLIMRMGRKVWDTWVMNISLLEMT